LIGKAYCYGAATIVNGIALGKGASYGIGLKTSAIVELTDSPGNFEVIIDVDKDENTLLAEYCVKLTLKKFDLKDEHGAIIKTKSNIPISRGLKSSSAAANAIVLATYSALHKELDEIIDLEVINLGIDASLEAKVTLTGAFDDACATYFGDVAVTNNLKREILDQYAIDEDYSVIIHVPGQKIRKKDIDTGHLKGIKPAIEVAHDLALNKNYLASILINGFTYGTAMGLDTGITLKALSAGAVTAGITGTGPATVILAPPDRKDDIITALDTDEQIICTSLNRKQAGIE
jgi:shikimate kinase